MSFFSFIMPTTPASPLVAVDINVVLVAEAALLQARLLISSEAHLRGMDFTRLSLELHNFDVTAPVITTPAEVARKFFVH